MVFFIAYFARDFLMILSQRVATWCGISAILMWAAMLGLIRQVTERFGAELGITLVYSLSTILLLVIFGLPNFKRMSKVYLVIGGTLFVIYEMCYSFAIGYAQTAQQAIEISVVNYLWPSLTILALIAFKQLKFHWMLLVGMSISISGLVYIQLGGESFSINRLFVNALSNPLSYGLAFIGAVLWSIYCAFTRSHGSKENPIGLFFCLVSIILWLKLIILGQDFSAVSWSTINLIYLIIAALSLGLGYGAWNIGMLYGNVTTLVASSYFSPVIAAFIAMLILGQTLSASFWQGACLVTLGSIVCWLTSNWSAIAPKLLKLQKSLS
jgi:drug/metabolite transporter (DMT)-like permease